MSRSRRPVQCAASGQQSTHDERTHDEQVDAHQLLEPVQPTVGHRGEPIGPRVDGLTADNDEPAPLEVDQFNVFILPSGRVLYEFGSQSEAERFFCNRILVSKEDLRAVIGELMTDTPTRAGIGARRAKTSPIDRNLVTTREFAAFVNCAESSVFEMLKLGLPSIKSPKLGRLILRSEAEAWILAGGASRSRTAKRLRKTNGTPR